MAFAVKRVLIQDALDMANIDQTAWRDDYNGRGQGGKPCPALRATEEELRMFLIQLAVFSDPGFDAAWYMAQNTTTDSMGRDSLVHAWWALEVQD